jgi:hypothetical protein
VSGPFAEGGHYFPAEGHLEVDVIAAVLEGGVNWTVWDGSRKRQTGRCEPRSDEPTPQEVRELTEADLTEHGWRITGDWRPVGGSGWRAPVERVDEPDDD